MTDRDPDAAATAFRALERAVAAATSTLSADTTVATTVAAAVDAVLQVDGVARRLGDTSVTAADVQFRPDDGSLSGLRTVQPALDLDNAGLLALTSHGVNGFSGADRRRTPAALPLSAHGVRLISADNGGSS